MLTRLPPKGNGRVGAKWGYMDLDELRKDHGDRIRAIAATHGASNVRVFGSVARGDASPTSDVDVLVEFEPGATAGFLRLAAMELELTEILGRRADLRTAAELSRYFRDEVVREAEVQYVAA